MTRTIARSGSNIGTGKVETATFAPNFALDPDSPAVHFNKMFRIGQPRPPSRRLPSSARRIHPIEPLKNPRLIRLRNPNPRIRHRKNHIGIARLGLNRNPPACQRVLRRVIQRILKDLRQPPPVRRNVRQITRLCRLRPFDLDLFLRCAMLRRLQAALDQLAYAHTPNFQLQPVRIHRRQLQQIVRQPRQPPRMLQNNPQKSLAILRIIHRPGQQRLRKSLDRRQRRLEFMRNVRHRKSRHAHASGFRNSVMSCNTNNRAQQRLSRPHRRHRRRKKCCRSVPVTISASTRGSPASTRRTASINSVCRTTSTSSYRLEAAHPAPECPQILDSQTPAAPSSSSPRRLPPCCPGIAAGQIQRSSVSVRIVRSIRDAVFGFNDAHSALSSASPDGPPGNGRKSPSATRRENSCNRSTRSEIPRDTNVEAIAAMSKITAEASHKLHRNDPNAISASSRGIANRKMIGEPSDKFRRTA